MPIVNLQGTAHGGTARRPLRSRARLAISGIALSFTLASMLVGAPSAAAKFPSPAPCLDILFVGARGSGQSFKGSDSDSHTGMGAQVHGAYKRFWRQVEPREVAGVAVIYPAQDVKILPVDPNAYFQGLEDGVAWVKNLLVKRSITCPAERLVLSGYSQGAMVMHRVMQDLAADGSAEANAVLVRIDGAILIADGDRTPIENTTNYGSAGRGTGISRQSPGMSGAREQALPDWLLPRIHSICDKRDLVCDFSAVYHSAAAGTAQGVYIHTHRYKGSGPVRQAADTVAKRLIEDSSTWNITPDSLGPLTIGMTGPQALATNTVERTPNSICNTPYEFKGEIGRPSSDSESVFMTWPAGPPDKLAGFFIKDARRRTPQGIGVGSTLAALKAAYGSQLEYPRYDPVIEAPVIRVPAVFGQQGVMIFGLNPDNVIEGIQLLAGRPGELLENTAIGC